MPRLSVPRALFFVCSSLFGPGLVLTGAVPGLLDPPTEGVITAFTRAPEIEQVALSPDGSYLGFVREHDGQKAIATFNLRTGKLAASSGSWKNDVAKFCWTGPESLVVLLVERMKYHNGFHTADKDLKNFRHVPGFLRLVAALPQDARRIILAGADTANFNNDLLEYDLKRERFNRLATNPGKVLSWHVDLKGQPRLAVVVQGPDRVGHLRYDPASDEWKPIALPENATPLYFDPSGRFVMLRFTGPAGRYIAQAYDLETSALVDQPTTDPVYDIDPEIIRDQETGAALGFRWAAARPRTQWSSGAHRNLTAKLQAAFPHAEVEPCGVLCDGRIALRVEADTRPPVIYVLDSRTGRLEVLLESRPWLAGRQLATMEPITLPARDGYSLHGYLTRSPVRAASAPAPTIVALHGGPHVRDHWGFDAEVQLFAALGYHVLQVDYRGSSGYGRPHELANILEVNERAVDDVADAIRWAVARGIAQPGKIVVYGGSYGGFLALGVASRYPELPAAAISFAGVFDWYDQAREIEKGTRQAYTWFSKRFPEAEANRARYLATSPRYRAAQVQAPVLLLHGEEDIVVDVYQTEHMAEALRKAGKTVTVVTDVFGIHGLPHAAKRQASYRAVVAFLRRHVTTE